MAAYRRVYDSRHLQADRDQLQNFTLGNRVWAAFTFLLRILCEQCQYASARTNAVSAHSGYDVEAIIR